MKKHLYIPVCAAAVFGAAVFIGGSSSTMAAEGCAAFPKTGYLSRHSHERLEAYVFNKLNGDWQRLNMILTKQLSALKRRRDHGRTATLRLGDKRRVLEGRELSAYIHLAETRLEIASCLARHHDPVNLARFETAAGGETLSRSGAPARLQELRVSAKTSCRGGETVIRLTNQGRDWPGRGELTILQLDGKGHRTGARRPMRMKESQSATFRIPATKNPTGRIGVFVKPSWYKRAFTLDADVSCG